ncbi:hypothetical protein [Agrobacterium sp. Azo12]|jgi:hypothetical protein|nr:hypothetical protein [Agrobacterium sp. Azo12]MDO5898828.1 hypothetical protein [Agrobacterium sp. Azo12]
MSICAIPDEVAVANPELCKKGRRLVVIPAIGQAAGLDEKARSNRGGQR